jgi:hypothetical protein
MLGSPAAQFSRVIPPAQLPVKMLGPRHRRTSSVAMRIGLRTVRRGACRGGQPEPVAGGPTFRFTTSKERLKVCTLAAGIWIHRRVIVRPRSSNYTLVVQVALAAVGRLPRRGVARRRSRCPGRAPAVIYVLYDL